MAETTATSHTFKPTVIKILVVCCSVILSSASWINMSGYMDRNNRTYNNSNYKRFTIKPPEKSNGASGEGNGWTGGAPMHQRIAGGRRATFGEIPFQVRVENHYGILCGGTLLDHCGLKFVLTAGHCVYSGNPMANSTFPPSVFSVIGADLDQFSYQPREQWFRVKHIELHESFDPRYLTNDLAIMFLDKYAFESLGLEHIELTQRGWEDPAYCRVSGWGSAVWKTDTSRYLKVAEVPVIEWAVCKNFKFVGWIGFLGPKEFCLGNDNNHHRTGICSGDSGGPAVAYNFTTEKWYLYGISSYVINKVCGDRLSASAYTRIADYADWIKAVAQAYLDKHGTGNPYTNGTSTC